MAGFEFAVPRSAVGNCPRIVVWEDGAFVRIAISSKDEVDSGADGGVLVTPNAGTTRDGDGGLTTALASGSAANSGTSPLSIALSKPETMALARGSWTSGGVSLPPGTELAFSYDDQDYFGIIDDGEMVFDDARSKSPSGAVMAAIRDRTDKVVNVNGWNYIDVTLPGESEALSLGSLRSSVLKRTR